MSIKWNYYVGVKTDEGLMLVTSFDPESKNYHYAQGAKPIKFKARLAEDLAITISKLSSSACVVKTISDLDVQPFLSSTEVVEHDGFAWGSVQ